MNATMNRYELYSDEIGFYTGQADYLLRSGGTGLSIFNPSRLIPASSFTTKAKINTLVGSVLEAMETVNEQLGPTLAPQVPFLILKTAPNSTPDAAKATSANPAWRNSLGTSSPRRSGYQASPTKSRVRSQPQHAPPWTWSRSPFLYRLRISTRLIQRSRIGTNVFFGENYNKLAQIKKKWDPLSLLNCKKCIGYLGPQDPMYSCYGR